MPVRPLPDRWSRGSNPRPSSVIVNRNAPGAGASSRTSTRRQRPCLKPASAAHVRRPRGPRALRRHVGPVPLPRHPLRLRPVHLRVRLPALDGVKAIADGPTMKSLMTTPDSGGAGPPRPGQPPRGCRAGAPGRARPRAGPRNDGCALLSEIFGDNRLRGTRGPDHPRSRSNGATARIQRGMAGAAGVDPAALTELPVRHVAPRSVCTPDRLQGALARLLAPASH